MKLWGNSMVTKDDRIALDFVKTLELTTELVQQLIADIKDGEINFSALKTELKNLVDNVKDTSALVKGTETRLQDLKLKVALLEKSVADLEEWSKDKQQKETLNVTSLAVADRTGKWQFAAIITTGLLTLVTTVVTILFNMGIFKK